MHLLCELHGLLLSQGAFGFVSCSLNFVYIATYLEGGKKCRSLGVKCQDIKVHILLRQYVYYDIVSMQNLCLLLL